MTDENLVSKKEVLESAGISYGQLYRWRRKGLIPESWFIRRSTFTGQETFFPRDKILDRIQRIKEMKDAHPLDDLADLISHQVNAKLTVALGKLRDLKWLDDALVSICRITPDEDQPVSLQDAFCLGVMSTLRETARSEEQELAHRTLTRAVGEGLLDRLPETPLQLYLLRKHLSGGGISAEISLVIIDGERLIVDPDTEEAGRVDLGNVLERIRLDLAKAADSATRNKD